MDSTIMIDQIDNKDSKRTWGTKRKKCTKSEHEWGEWYRGNTTYDHRKCIHCQLKQTRPTLLKRIEIAGVKI